MSATWNFEFSIFAGSAFVALSYYIYKRFRVGKPLEVGEVPCSPNGDERPQPYNFNVDVKDEYGTTLNRQEIGDDLGNKRGSYGNTDPYGIARQVDYVADEQGFREVIKTNEPGGLALSQRYRIEIGKIAI